MTAMSPKNALAKVAEDLERGHTFLAGQRLTSLTQTYPHDLDLRARRGRLNRQIGNFAEAGRWGYLTEDLAPREQAAFEGMFKRPSDRLCALKLKSDPRPRLGPLALARLDDLIRQAETGAEPVTWEDGSPATESRAGTAGAVGCVLGLLLAVIGVLGLAGYGVYALLWLS